MRNKWTIALMFAAGLAWPVAASPRTGGQAPPAGSTPAAQEAAAPTIAGAWQLNPDLSDKPGARPNNRRNGGQDGGGNGGYGGRGRMGGGFGGGRMGGGMHGGGNGDPQARQARMEVMREILQPVEQFTLTLANDNKDVSMAYTDGRVFQFKADGSKEKHQLTNGTVDTKTKWDGPKLEIEYDLDGGFKVVRDYSLSDKTHQLVVTTKMEGGRGGRGRDMKAVYDAAGQ